MQEVAGLGDFDRAEIVSGSKRRTPHHHEGGNIQPGLVHAPLIVSVIAKDKKRSPGRNPGGGFGHQGVRPAEIPLVVRTVNTERVAGIVSEFDVRRHQCVMAFGEKSQGLAHPPLIPPHHGIGAEKRMNKTLLERVAELVEMARTPRHASPPRTLQLTEK